MIKNGSSKQESDSPDYKSALLRAAELCSKQEQCSSHIRDKLGEWKVKAEEAEKVLLKLKEEQYLDDHRYALFYARDKFRLNKWGKIKIAHMLRMKGISDPDIGHALDQIDEEAYFQVCFELVKNKSATLKDKNQFARKGKLYRFAAGRGFEPDLIHRAMVRADEP
jgi:regulatory protein